MKTMKAAYASSYGKADVLQVKNLPIPEPSGNQLLIEVKSSCITRADVMIRTGKPYFGRLIIGIKRPKHPVPGTAFSGIVKAVGPDCNKYKIGDEVFGETTLGFSAHAEFLVIPEDGIVLPKPSSLSFQEAATLCDGPITSYNFLQSVVSIKVGQQVLINGASGSLGTAAVQIATKLGAEVTAVCSTKNVALVKSLGAKVVVDYTKTDFTQEKTNYDVIFDTVGVLSFKKCKSVLKPQGVYLSPVLSFSLLLDVLFTSMFGKKKAVFSATGLKKDNELRVLVEGFMKLLGNNSYQTVIDRQFPLERIVEAHRYVEMGHKKGSVVLHVQE